MGYLRHNGWESNGKEHGQLNGNFYLGLGMLSPNGEAHGKSNGKWCYTAVDRAYWERKGLARIRIPLFGGPCNQEDHRIFGSILRPSSYKHPDVLAEGKQKS